MHLILLKPVYVQHSDQHLNAYRNHSDYVPYHNQGQQNSNGNHSRKFHNDGQGLIDQISIPNGNLNLHHHLLQHHLDGHRHHLFIP